MRVGILALQGAVGKHREKFVGLGAEPVEVRRPGDLEGLSGIVLPGGESTTFLHLLKLHELWDPLKAFASARPAWGVCAGAILLARKVTSPSQESLGLFDAWLERNAYGRQNESFIAPLDPEPGEGAPERFEGIFIRAPRIRELGPGARVVYRHRGEPVMAVQGHLWISAFHPELTDSDRIHQGFLDACRSTR